MIRHYFAENTPVEEVKEIAENTNPSTEILYSHNYPYKEKNTPIPLFANKLKGNTIVTPRTSSENLTDISLDCISIRNNLLYNSNNQQVKINYEHETIQEIKALPKDQNAIRIFGPLTSAIAKELPEHIKALYVDIRNYINFENLREEIALIPIIRDEPLDTTTKNQLNNIIERNNKLNKDNETFELYQSLVIKNITQNGCLHREKLCSVCIPGPLTVRISSKLCASKVEKLCFGDATHQAVKALPKEIKFIELRKSSYSIPLKELPESADSLIFCYSPEPDKLTKLPQHIKTLFFEVPPTKEFIEAIPFWVTSIGVLNPHEPTTKEIREWEGFLASLPCNITNLFITPNMSSKIDFSKLSKGVKKLFFNKKNFFKCCIPKSIEEVEIDTLQKEEIDFIPAHLKISISEKTLPSKKILIENILKEKFELHSESIPSRNSIHSTSIPNGESSYVTNSNFKYLRPTFPNTHFKYSGNLRTNPIGYFEFSNPALLPDFTDYPEKETSFSRQLLDQAKENAKNYIDTCLRNAIQQYTQPQIDSEALLKSVMEEYDDTIYQKKESHKRHTGLKALEEKEEPFTKRKKKDEPPPREEFLKTLRSYIEETANEMSITCIRPEESEHRDSYQQRKKTRYNPLSQTENYLPSTLLRTKRYDYDPKTDQENANQTKIPFSRTITLKRNRGNEVRNQETISPPISVKSYMHRLLTKHLNTFRKEKKGLPEFYYTPNDPRVLPPSEKELREIIYDFLISHFPDKKNKLNWDKLTANKEFQIISITQELFLKGRKKFKLILSDELRDWILKKATDFSEENEKNMTLTNTETEEEIESTRLVF